MVLGVGFMAVVVVLMVVVELMVVVVVVVVAYIASSTSGIFRSVSWGFHNTSLLYVCVLWIKLRQENGSSL